MELAPEWFAETIVSARPGYPFLIHEEALEIPWGKYFCAAILRDHEEVLIAGHEIISTARRGASENLVIVRVRALWADRVNLPAYFTLCLSQKVTDVG